MSRKGKKWNASRPLRPAEDFGVYDERTSPKRRTHITQAVEVTPGRVVEISYDTTTHEFFALGFHQESRLKLIDMILDDWLLTESVTEVMGGRRELGEEA